MGIPQPLTHTDYPVGGRDPLYTIACHSPKEVNLSLSGLQVKDGAPTNRDLALYIWSRLPTNLVDDWMYVQNDHPGEPVGARIAELEEFDSAFHLFSRTHVYTANAPAQGTWITKGMGLLFNTRAAPILVFRGGDHYCAVMARRDSLIDRELVISGTPSREHESVLDAVIQEYRKRGVNDPSQIFVRGYFGLDSKANKLALDHPEYGIFNSTLRQFFGKSRKPVVRESDDGTIQLSLTMLIEQQAEERGITFLGCSYKIPADMGFATPMHRLPQLRGFSNLAVVYRPY